DFGVLDFDGAGVFFGTAAVEDFDTHNRTVNARGQTEGGVADIGGLLAKNGAEELFFRRHRGFALRSDFTDENVARADFGTDGDDTGVVEVAEGFFPDVRDVAGNFFAA